MDIAERIKKLRESYGITSNELADITGIHPVSIRKYETRKMVPGIEVIDKMCEALRLPRMIFEGIPKQYTDFSFEGDFYQLLFLLMANGTLDARGKCVEDTEEETYFSLNPQLSKYIEIKNGDEVIPIENLTIHPCADRNRIIQTLNRLNYYLIFMRKAHAALEAKGWDAKKKGETREEYAARIMKLAEKEQFELMLEGHSWKQHMTGVGNKEQTLEALDKHILEGGDYYSFVMQADLPEAEKNRYIEAFEEAYISEIVEEQIGSYPGDKSQEEKSAWIDSKIELIEKYKTDHPDYKEQAKQHAIDNAQKARETESTCFSFYKKK